MVCALVGQVVEEEESNEKAQRCRQLRWDYSVDYYHCCYCCYYCYCLDVVDEVAESLHPDHQICFSLQLHSYLYLQTELQIAHCRYHIKTHAETLTRIRGEYWD